MKRKSIGIVLLAVALFISGYAIMGSAATTTTPVKLQWFSNVSFWNPPLTWSTDPKTVQGAITKKTGLTFEMNIPPQDADTKLSLMLVSSQLPDVMTITNDVLYKKLVQSQKVWKLDELLKKYDPKSHLLKDFPSDIKQALILRDGGWYAFPSHMSSNKAREQYPPSDQYYIDGYKYRDNGGIMFNTKLMRQAGITLDQVKTEDGLLAAYKKISDMKLTVDGAPVIPLLVDGKVYQDNTLATLRNMFGCMSAATGDYIYMSVDKDGSIRDPLLTPENKHAMEFLYKAVKSGFIDPNQFTMDKIATKAACKSGRVFSFLGNTADTGFSDQENWTSPGPLLSNTGARPTLGRALRTQTGWMQTFISKSTKAPQRLAKWLSFMSSDEGMRLAYYGFKGIDYTVNQKGLIVQTELGIKHSTDYSKTGIFAYWPFHNISWHDSVTQAPTTQKTGPDGIVALQVQTAYGKAKETYLYDNSPLQLPADYIPAGSELGNIHLQIKQYRETQISRIILADDDGTMNKLYDEMIAKLKELGIEKLDAKINEQIQKQYKEYGVSLKGIN